MTEEIKDKSGMTPEERNILKDILDGKNITAENLIIAYKAAQAHQDSEEAKMMRDTIAEAEKIAMPAKKFLDALDNDVATVYDKMIEYAKNVGDIPFENDKGQSKAYHYDETIKKTLSQTGKDIIITRYPTFNKVISKFDESKANEYLKEGKFTDADILDEVITTITPKLKTISVKKSKAIVSDEGGDE